MVVLVNGSIFNVHRVHRVEILSIFCFCMCPHRQWRVVVVDFNVAYCLLYDDHGQAGHVLVCVLYRKEELTPHIFRAMYTYVPVSGIVNSNMSSMGCNDSIIFLPQSLFQSRCCNQTTFCGGRHTSCA